MQNDTPPAPVKGARLPFPITQKSKRRVVCGLSWNPQSRKSSGIGTLIGTLTGVNVKPYDLDLMCIIYDASGAAIDGISGGPGELMDSSGKIYHSGDDTTGVGNNDDEQIYVETLDLPAAIHHIVFIAEIQSGHTFGAVEQPEMRLADGFDDRVVVHAPLQQPDGMDKTAFVFARMHRDGDGWAVHYIGEYFNGRQVADWTETCKPYLK